MTMTRAASGAGAAEGAETSQAAEAAGRTGPAGTGPADTVRSNATRGADPAAVGRYLAEHLRDDAWRSCTVTIISGGKSNLTFLVTSGTGEEVVLRRPPLSTVLATAHDMAREHRVLTALRDTAVPVPSTRLLCEDPGVIGAPFYVMDRVAGHIVRGTLPAGYAETDEERAAMTSALVEVLAAVHGVPIAGRLDGFGPPSGYLQRQLRRWTKQWEASKQTPLPDLDALAARLAAAPPQQRETTLVHGDYRLDNVIFDPVRPGRVAAVLDWELSTLGDPFADLGLLLVYWGDKRRGMPSVVPTVTTQAGFPGPAEVARQYAAVRGRDVSDLPWYVAFGSFKLAVIAAGVAARLRAGAMSVGPGAPAPDALDAAAEAVALLVAQGHDVLSGRS